MNSLYLLPLLFSLALADLILYEAGASPSSQGPVDGATICPTDFAYGISIQCTNLPGAKYANFTVDGIQVRQEKSRPYYIAGDVISTGFVNPWSAPFGQTVKIECVGSNNLSHIAEVTFFCQPIPDPTPEPEPTPLSFDDLEPGTMVFVEAGRDGAVGPELMDDLTFCPDTFESGRFSIFCKEGPDSARARFFVNRMKVRSDSSVPFHINRDFRGNVKAWMDAPEGFFVIECRLGANVKSQARVRVSCDEEPEPTMESVPKGEPMITQKADGCTLIDSRLSDLSQGWKETDEGVIFREGNPSLSIVAAGRFPLEYKFTPVVTSHYAVVVDMTTMDSRDYNDIWIKVDGDFTLIRRGVTKEGEGDGWIKGYHNADGRKSFISSIDFNAHSISTRAVLKAGVEYTFMISGRSTQVEVHKIILFPCGMEEGSICQRGDRTWKDFMVSCAGDENP